MLGFFTALVFDRYINAVIQGLSQRFVVCGALPCRVPRLLAYIRLRSRNLAFDRVKHQNEFFERIFHTGRTDLDIRL